MKTKILKIGKNKITLSDIQDVAIRGRRVEIDSAAKLKIKKSFDYLQKKAKSKETIYGVNTGFGLLSNVKIKSSDIEQLQYNLIRSHAVGTGAPLSPYVSRAICLLRAVNLAQGYSGVSPSTIQALLNLLNQGIAPVIPEQGSVGASGDLAPLAHLALVLIGEGHAWVDGKVVEGATALKKKNLKPIKLGAKEGLALINGTQFMTAIGALTLLEAEYLCDIADVTGAMTVEALKGTTVAFDSDIHAVRSHPGQVLVANRMRNLLAPKNKLSEIALSHTDCDKVQDPYSLRCIPQVHGASRDALRFVREVLEKEINSVTDNPLVFSESNKIISGGNFHGQIVSIAMDILSIAMAEIASVSEQRIEKLVNPSISGLPAFLIKEGGLNSGFMIVQVAAASIVSENKTLCHPASVDSIPTSADKEDHVSMGAWAARKASQVTDNTRRVLAMELMSAAQGIDFHLPLKSSTKIEAVRKTIREQVPFLDKDRTLYPDIYRIEKLLLDHKIGAMA